MIESVVPDGSRREMKSLLRAGQLLQSPQRAKGGVFKPIK